MGRCPAPCDGHIAKEDYLKIIDEVKFFLSGKRKQLLDSLGKKMLILSNELKFEEAATIRNRINNLRHAWESQKVVAPGLGDIDVMGFHSDGTDALFDIFFIRNGILIGTKDFYLRDVGMLSRKELFRSFMELFYAKEIMPPAEIVAGDKPDELKDLKIWLADKKGKKVAIKIPQKGRRFELLRMANENAQQLFKNKQITRTDERLKAVKNHLKLPYLPASIGAFDVSTIAGSESVGAFVFWSEGAFNKELYRHLKIKGVSGIDDYSMMNETMARILSKLENKIPDLIIVDGGKGQLEVGRDVVEKNKITCANGRQPMLIAIAKDPDRAFTLSSDIIDLEDNSPESLLLKRMRDEVHRFAVSYHRKLRGRRVMESPLEKISGIGKKRRLELLRHFGSIDAIKKASREEVAKIKGFNKLVAENLLGELRRR